MLPHTLTVLNHSTITTDKTDETGLVSNSDFMIAVFGNDRVGSLPIVISFEGNPTNAPNKVWFGRPWIANSDQTFKLPDNNNNYFSLSTFNKNDEGQYRRQKANFHSLHTVMLDDVGTKVPMERLTLKPSWLLETSPGNFQAGYLLKEPLSDGKVADELMNAIITAGLCDPGSNGPRSRLARLPVAVNGKYSPPYICRLREWAPELRYSAKELAEGLQLELSASNKQKCESSKFGDPQSDESQVWIPRPNENAVLSALRSHNLYKTPLGEGKHDITCPWVSEHTNTTDGGTAFFEQDDNRPIGGFKCLHGHCQDRHIRELLIFLKIEVNEARMKPIIRVINGEIHQVVDAAERELAHSNRHYQRGGLIVTVVTDPSTRETRVQEVTQPALVRALAQVAIWEKFDGRSEDWARTDPPARHTAVLFDSNSYPHLPVLQGIARQPYLRQDGSLMNNAGFDSVTGMFGIFNEKEFSVPNIPTRDEAEIALTLLKSLLAEFSFADATDMTAALVAILTATVRPSIPNAPLFHVLAHMPGSGKSYLCRLIIAFCTPMHSTPTTFPADDEECRKLLLAELLRSPAVIEFDNLTSDLIPHKSLCIALTSEHMSGRVLGVSKTATVSTRTLFLSSGNNVKPVQDMVRRCITIRISPDCEIPASRVFDRPQLISDVLHERGRYVSAALTIIRAWITAGRPITNCHSLTSFGEWSDLCRQPLMWLCLPDPTTSVFEAMNEDPDREALLRLLSCWQSVFGKTAAMVRDAVRLSYEHQNRYEELREIINDIANERGEINRRKLGWWIKRHAGQIVDGMRFVRATGNRSAEAWMVESVSSVLSVSVSQITKSVTTYTDTGDYLRATRGA